MRLTFLPPLPHNKSQKKSRLLFQKFEIFRTNKSIRRAQVFDMIFLSSRIPLYTNRPGCEHWFSLHHKMSQCRCTDQTPAAINPPRQDPFPDHKGPSWSENETGAKIVPRSSFFVFVGRKHRPEQRRRQMSRNPRQMSSS